MKLRYKMILLFMSMIIILSVITGTYSISQMKSKIIASAQSKLHSDLALTRTLINSRYPGDWQLIDGNLYKGDYLFNNQFDFVDEIGELTGDTVTIFQQDTRIATNVIQADGTRAINTQISEEVGNIVLKKGETYVGKANVVGTWNQTVYEPIIDSNRNIIGILYVGVPNTLYDKMANDFRTNLILFITIGVLCFSFLVWILCSKIFSPLTTLETATQKMATGDLTTKVEIASRDELRALASAFNTLGERFNKVLYNISAASCEVNTSSEQVSSSSKSLSQGALEQASAIEELNSRIQDICNQMQQNSNATQKVNALSEIVSTHALEGSKNMSSLQNAIHEINQTSHDISKIVSIIDNIAFQTNILSLNASVEAAQSGKYGLGFAVVAEEVRNLAIKVSIAAKDTADLIKISLDKVDEGMKIVDSNAKSLDLIISGIDDISSALNTIYIATKEQSTNIKHVSLQISQVAAITQNTSAISEETLATSVELHGQAQALDHQVQIFKLA